MAKPLSSLDVLKQYHGFLAPGAGLKSATDEFKSRLYGNEISQRIAKNLATVPDCQQFIDDFLNIYKGAPAGTWVLRGSHYLTDSALNQKILDGHKTDGETHVIEPAVRIWTTPSDDSSLILPQYNLPANWIRPLSRPDLPKGTKPVTEFNIPSPYLIALFNLPTVTPQTHDADVTQIFLDMIPSIEMSRCVPYFDMRIISGNAPVKGDVAHSLTIFKQLFGQTKLTPGAKQFAGGKDAQLQEPTSTNTVAGMELFTAPQTMIPLERPIGSGAEIIDKMRPSMSFNGMSINLAPNGGAMSFKTGELSFTLFDRSRLGDITDLLSPEYYSNVRFEITTGWSHPDETGNAWGELLKSMRRSELYQVYDTSFSISGAGVVDLKVKVAMTGARESNRVDIIDDQKTGLEKQMQKIQKLATAIKEIVSLVPDLNKRTRLFKEARASQLLSAAGNPMAVVAADNELDVEINRLINDLKITTKNTPAFEQVEKLGKQFRELYGADPGSASSGGALGTYKNNLAAAINTKLLGVKTGADEFLTNRTIKRFTNESIKAVIEGQEEQLAALKKLIGKPTDRSNTISFYGSLDLFKTQRKSSKPKVKAEGTRKVPSAEAKIKRAEAMVKVYEASLQKTKEAGTASGGIETVKALGLVSLGKLFHEFVVKPLAASGRFSDVQMIFYPMNDKAGKAGCIWDPAGNIVGLHQIGTNIASFVIDSGEFATEFSAYCRKKGTTNMSVSEFINFVLNTFTDDTRAWMYGVTEAFAPTLAGGSGGDIQRQVQKQIEITKKRVNWKKTAYEARVAREKLKKGEVNVNKALIAKSRAEACLQVTPADKAGKGGTFYRFKKPNIECYLETKLAERTANKPPPTPPVPDVISGGSATPVPPKTPKKKTQKDVLRIHIYDATMSPYSKEEEVLARATNERLLDKDNIRNTKALLKGIVEAKDVKGEVILSTTREVTGKLEDISGLPLTVQTIKSLLHKTVPSIIFGSNNTAVLDASVSSLQDKGLANVALLKQGKSSPLTPKSVNEGGLPLRVRPTYVDLTMLGCPTISFTQQYFIDFGTGTTIDNIYGVVGASHTIGPGTFTTSVKLAPLDAWGKFLTFRELIGI
jgi:hypothetical protein